MKNSKKLILVMVSIICIVILLVGSIAYYRIVVNGSIKGSTGNAVFVLRDSDNSVWNNKVIDLGKINPGDSGEFTVTMDASGSTVDIYATLEIERTNLPTNLKFYTTSDHKSELHKYYSFLENNGTNSETLTIYWYWNPYIDDIEDSKFINVSNLEANIRVSAVQISEYAMMKNGVSYVPSTHAYNGTEFWNDDYRPYIRMINFGNDLSNLPDVCNDANMCWDVSGISGQKKKVYAYLVDSGLKDSTDITEALYNLYIVSEAPIFAPIDCSFMFSNFNNLEILNFNNNFNTSYTTSMKAMFMPIQTGSAGGRSSYTESRIMLLANEEDEQIDDGYGLENKIVKLDLSGFNTSKVTNMSSMFRSCSSLTNLDLSNFNTSNVTHVEYMFVGCSSLTSLDLNGFNTSSVTNMGDMFNGCLSLTSLDLSSFNTSNVTYMDDMFYNCSSLTNLDLSSFNTSNVTNMQRMFGGCSSLTSLDLSSFNTSNVTSMYNMFSGCSSLTSLDLSIFNISNVTNMSYMFQGCISINNLDISTFYLSSSSLSIITNVQFKSLTTTINYIGTNNVSFSNIQSGHITINYTSSNESIVDTMVANYPNILIKGKLITAPTS